MEDKTSTPKKGRKQMTTTAEAIERCDVQCGICGTTIPHVTYAIPYIPEFDEKDYDNIYFVESYVSGKYLCIPCKKSFGDLRSQFNARLLISEYNSWEFAFQPLENADDVKAFVEGLQDKGILWMGWTPSDRFDEQEIDTTDRIREVLPKQANGLWQTELVTFSRELLSPYQRNSLNHRLDEALGLVGSLGLDEIIDDVKEEHRTANLLGYND